MSPARRDRRREAPWRRLEARGRPRSSRVRSVTVPASWPHRRAPSGLWIIHDGRRVISASAARLRKRHATLLRNYRRRHHGLVPRRHARRPAPARSSWPSLHHARLCLDAGRHFRPPRPSRRDTRFGGGRRRRRIDPPGRHRAGGRGDPARGPGSGPRPAREVVSTDTSKRRSPARPSRPARAS